MSPSEMRQQSPLDQFYTRIGNAMVDESAPVVMQERPFLAHINLRGTPDDAGFLSDTASVLGFDLPLQPNTWAGFDDLRVCWLGPDEWLLITSGGADEWGDALRAANESRFCALTVVSGGQTMLRFWGDRVRDVFAKGCTLDFHDSAFTTGQCAQSNLAKAPALFIQAADDPVYELIIRRSFSDYIGHWLEDAAHEFGLRVVR